MKYVELSKRSKKAQREYFKTQRVTDNFNIGEREMQTDKNPSRARRKMLDKEALQ